MRSFGFGQKICRNCKIIRRKGVCVICTDPAPQAAPGLIGKFGGRIWHVSLVSTFRRISTLNRFDRHFGIGRTCARKICEATGHRLFQEGQRPDGRDLEKSRPNRSVHHRR